MTKNKKQNLKGIVAICLALVVGIAISATAAVKAFSPAGSVVFTGANEITINASEAGEDVLGGSTSADWNVGGNLSVTGTISGNINESVVSATGASTLTSSQNGSTVYMDMDEGATLTLPSAASGLAYTFVVADNFGTSSIVIDSAEGDNIEGTLLVAGAVVDCAGEDQINFVSDGENVGDYVELRSDGTNWLIGSSGALTAAKLTCTDPS